MRTLGIDLASTAGSTGICEINWESRTSWVEVGRFQDGLLLDRVREIRASQGWSSIDPPFGFPAAFSRAVAAWCSEGAVDLDSDHDIRRRLSDAYVARRQSAIKSTLPGGWNPWPLSSVVDLITPSVIRCARILTLVSDGDPVDRIGLRSRVVEAYPIAALRAWGVPTDRYKRNKADCERVLAHLCEHTDLRPPQLRGKLASGGDDDVVDAFVCALLARVVATAGGATDPAFVDPPLDLEVVRSEGWIHLPPAGHRLEDLALL